MSKNRILFLTQFGLLLAIEAIFCFTPLGSIPFTPTVVATIAMIPVIVTSILLGVWAGTVMGLIAAVFSFTVWLLWTPNPAIAFLFNPFYSTGDFHGNFGSLLICFVPRILVGTVTGATYSAFRKLFKGKDKDLAAMVLSSALGSATNTAGFVLGAWLFFGNQLSSSLGAGITVILGGVILTNGLPEAVVSAVVAPLICKPVKLALPKMRG